MPQLNNKKIELNFQFTQALDLMEKSKKNLFITGRAGTGKSTLLQYFRQTTQKDPVVLAPTGVAAVNIEGQTIHSFFNFRPDITAEKVKKKYSQVKNDIYSKMKMLIIDEISMVRADLLDCVDLFLRLNGPQKGKPFGGVQLVFIGDLYQLPPVVTSQEKKIFETLYESPYFFDSCGFQSIPWEIIFLEKIYRQKDSDFIQILNSVRNRSVSEDDLDKINTRYQEKIVLPENSFFIHLTTTNRLAEKVNMEKLSRLDSELFEFEAEISGDLGEKSFPAPKKLSLKEGSQVMLVNNDSLGRWINGTVGKVLGIEKEGDSLFRVIIELEDGQVVELYPHTWKIFRFYFDGKNRRISSETVGSFTQFPLILAWGITIHKSQGKTFEKVVLDLGRGTFAHGQAYVALSRCTSLDGLILKKPLQKKHILLDWRVVNFLTSFQYEKSDNQMPLEEKISFLQTCLKEKSRLEITYLKSSDEKSQRVILPISLKEEEFHGKKFLGLKAFCFSRKAERMFRVDRILKMKEV